ncbi:hypothetical protein Tco_0654007 [Tanacetum coccineum]|uniref:Reverse transcriptase domain-containing protein n=1 Tax=Tanacetum coccineum TaxID=301880 RepID=A0ABQ4X2A8_9ASTR
MRTRSSGPVVEPSTTPRRRRNKKHSQQVDPTIVEKPVVTIADTYNMAELLQAPTKGYGDAIVIPAILAENFKLNHGLLNLVTSKQFCNFEKEDPHAHIRWFNKITSTIKHRSDLKISFVHAHIMVSQNYTKLILFYNSLTSTDQDSLNAAAGGNLLTKTPKDALTLIENKSKVRTLQNRPVVAKVSMNTSTSGLSPDVVALTDAVKALLLKNTTHPPASVKAVEESCDTCGGPHPYYQCLATMAVIKTNIKHIYSYNDAESINRIDVIDIACEEYSQEVLGFSDNSETYLARDSVPPGVDDAEFNPEGDIRLIEEMLNNDSYSPLLPKNLKYEELKSVKSSIDEPPELELKDLPSHLEYAFLEGTNKLPIIIAKNLKDEEKEHLIKVLKSHKQAIAWKLSDIKGIDPQFCPHKILMEDDFKPAVQHQRRVNPKIHKVIKKEVVKLLDVGLIYPISDSPWVSPVHCVPKKGRMTVVTNEDNELIPTRLVTGWRVCIDYRKLNDATRKDHFPLPFMDQMLERLAGNEYFLCIGYKSGYLLKRRKVFVVPGVPKRNLSRNVYTLRIR